MRCQCLPPSQWIVADGNSTDGTVEWLNSIDYPPLVWTSEPDGGIYEGMNNGLRQIDADYVLFLNSGDVLAGPRILECMTTAITASASRPALIYGDCIEVDASGVNHLRRARPAYWVPIGMPTSHQAMYFRRDAIPSGFDTRYRLSADYAAVMQLYVAQRGADFQYLPMVLCRAQLGGRSQQQRARGLREDMEIRKRVLGMGGVALYALHGLHHMHDRMKRHLPAVHRLARYD